MKKRKLKNWVIVGLYMIAFLSIMGTLYFLEDKNYKEPTYVKETIVNVEQPVIKLSDSIIRPYTASNVVLTKLFYNHQDTSENQVNSLIYYEGTYLPNSGVDYTSEEVFDVNSILEGVVTNVEENNLLGKIVEITHDNNLISVYQSLSEVTVKLNDPIVKGQVIGKSGYSNLSVDLSNHLHFEIIHNGTNVNPESYYDKSINEL